MKNFCLFFVLITSTLIASSQVQRPKLVVGIVVDQMRWDYLYRYYNKYSDGGFKRMLGEGFTCGNTLINYLPSYTGVGHATVFTGSVPSIHGITGNDWRNQATGKNMYCTDDSTVSSVGAAGKAGKMSPRNLMVTTITDELRLATNFKSKVVGVSLKDRASILPAGHNPTGAYWMDDASGNFITSTWYMQQLPSWVSKFNGESHIEKFISKGWQTLLKQEDYTQSTEDNVPWEGKLSGAATPAFPFDLNLAYSKNKGSIRSTPFGNTLTLDFAKAAVAGESLGKGSSTDFLTVNCASTDYVGHMTGVNSIEIEDTYLRLDRDLASFFSYLDKNVGKGNYMVFLTADHGAAHAIGFMEKNKMPAGYEPELKKGLNEELKKYFTAGDGLVLGLDNDQVNFDNSQIEKLGLNKDELKKVAMKFIAKQPAVLFVVDASDPAGMAVPTQIKDMVINGYNRERSGEIKIIWQSGFLSAYNKTGTTHGSWNNYDTQIPLVFMGWKIPHGETNQTVQMTDISATLAALLHIQMPSGCIGNPITAITDKVNK